MKIYELLERVIDSSPDDYKLERIQSVYLGMLLRNLVLEKLGIC